MSAAVELVPASETGPDMAGLAELGLTEEQLAGAFQLFRRMNVVAVTQVRSVPPHLSNERLISDWFSHNRTDWADGTRTVRKSQVGMLVRFLDPVPLIHASEDELLAYRDQLTCGPNALASHCSMMSSLYHYISVARRLREDNPAAAIRRPKVPKKRIPRRITETELALVEKAVEFVPDLKAWLLLMGHGGFRCSDVAWLKVEDVTDDTDGAAAGWARITGKGGVVRQVPLTREVMAALAEFRKAGPGPMFRRPSDGQAHTPNGVSRRVNDLLRDLGIPRTAHSLRHRFATEFAKLDPDLRNLQQVMGHSDISTTTIYAQVEPEACADGVVALGERTRQRRQRA